MPLSFAKPQLLVAAALVLMVAACAGEALGQDAANVAADEQQIQRWVEELAAPNFATRTAATAALQKSGEVAIPALKRALTGAGSESRQRIESILKRLQQNTFDGRLHQLLERPNAAMAARLPDWERFTKTVGDDQESVEFFIRLLQAEPALFAISFKNPADLRIALQKRSEELMPKAGEQLDVDSFAALLFLASNDKVILRGATSYNITTIMVNEYAAALKLDDGARYLKLVGGWMLRPNIAVGRPLNFARSHRLQQGPILARRTLAGVLRANDGIEALMLLKDQGTAEDIVLVESLFDQDNPNYNERSDRGVIFKGRKTDIQYTCCYGDLALAVAIAMRGKNPADFGFARRDPNVKLFAFNEGTTGFESEDDRQAARQKYFAAFGK